MDGLAFRGPSKLDCESMDEAREDTVRVKWDKMELFTKTGSLVIQQLLNYRSRYFLASRNLRLLRTLFIHSKRH